MYAAWGTPTVSDAAKLELLRGWEYSLFGVQDGEQLYRLKEQPLLVEDWGDAAAWTEVDSGANVALAGGVWSMNGNGTVNLNGIHHTAGLALVAGCSFIEVKMLWPNASVSDMFGVSDAAALKHNTVVPIVMGNTAASARVPYNWVAGGLAGGALSLVPITHSTYYTVRIYFLKNAADVARRNAYTIQGGAEFPTETLVCVCEHTNTMPATVYPVCQRWTNSAGNLTQFKEFRAYVGLSAAGPTLTFVFDAGADRAFSDIDLTNIAPMGGWDTTNVTFAWAADDVDGKQAFSAEKTLAQLQALGALGESHRYFGLRITVNSDGATQQYAGKMNASDLIESIINTAEVWPSEDDVRDGEDYGPTGADYTGNATFPAEGDVQSGVPYGAAGVEYTGTFVVPSEADVEFGVDYGAAAEFTGTFVAPAEGDVEFGVDYGAAAEFTGTFEAPAEGDVRDGVGYGAAGAEYTGDVEIPAEADVEFGVGFGSGGVEYTGAFVVPLEADVEAGVDYGAAAEFTGTFVVPADTDVRDGVSFGAGGVEFTGDVELPLEADVETGVGYGSAGVEFTGTFDVPLEADVEAGVGYGDGGVEFTGAFVVPGVGDVELGVNYGAAAEFSGTFVVPAEATVQLGVPYGAAGVEFTGTLVGGGGLTPGQELLLQELHAVVVQEVGDTREETPAARSVTSATLAKTMNWAKAGDAVTSLAATRGADT